MFQAGRSRGGRSRGCNGIMKTDSEGVLMPHPFDFIETTDQTNMISNSIFFCLTMAPQVTKALPKETVFCSLRKCFLNRMY